MRLILDLPAEEQVQFDAWTHRHGEEIERDAAVLFKSVDRSWSLFGNLFLKAITLLQPVLPELEETSQTFVKYLLLLLQTMTALYHANSGRPYTWTEMSSRSRLADAMTLYDLEIVSLEIAARIAGVSQSVFMEALGKAGISIFQYSLEEAVAEAEAA